MQNNLLAMLGEGYQVVLSLVSNSASPSPTALKRSCASAYNIGLINGTTELTEVHYDDRTQEDLIGMLTEPAQYGLCIMRRVLTLKFGKESDLWVQLDEESVWRKEGFLRCIRQKGLRSAICFRSAREQLS
jgi:hypothetical protein